ncbi:uncharacterized protein C2845_PM03G01750 [Panicum miliaceum]|uniref:DUF1618 domain-containing protein n=1 Tax=Panicum miliaceum TaxID=4540 RepID=A0A3L6T7A3_PANMI|nr:uncharacterized protein C2845_PM03G01750 [Panicum miliaceum]
MAAPAAFPASSERHDVPSFVLLDTSSYNAGRPNASAATSKTSTGLPIEVTFCAVPPRDLSYLIVRCPGLEVDPTDLFLAPRIISADADLVLLRISRDAMAAMFPSHSDYFVCKLNQEARLDLLPNPYPDRFSDEEFAILSCGNSYVVAAIRIKSHREFAFMLHTYRSGPDGEPGSWTSKRVSVEDPSRDRVCPIPRSATRVLYHMTSKAITLGGAKGTVGWVDLWRGILLCDLLEDSPKLRDMPLPLPVKGNWQKFMIDPPHYDRDIAVNQSRDTIKFVEMEITQPTKATTWSMPIPVTSWNNWQRQCVIRSEDIHLPPDNTEHYKLLRKLMSSGDKEKVITEEAALSLGCLRMAYPIVSINDDDDVVYLLSKGYSTRSVEVVVAVDVRTGTLRGVAKLDTDRHFGFMRGGWLASGISKYLETMGTPTVLFMFYDLKTKLEAAVRPWSGKKLG